MSRKYKFHNPEGVYFVSFAVQGWVDVFTRNEYKNIIVDNLKYCQEHKGLEIFAWCIMTSHIHLIIRAGRDIPLQDILRDYKKFTSKAIIMQLRKIFRKAKKNGCSSNSEHQKVTDFGEEIINQLNCGVIK